MTRSDLAERVFILAEKKDKTWECIAKLSDDKLQEVYKRLVTSYHAGGIQTTAIDWWRL